MSEHESIGGELERKTRRRFEVDSEIERITENLKMMKHAGSSPEVEARRQEFTTELERLKTEQAELKNSVL